MDIFSEHADLAKLREDNAAFGPLAEVSMMIDGWLQESRQARPYSMRQAVLLAKATAAEQVLRKVIAALSSRADSAH